MKVIIQTIILLMALNVQSQTESTKLIYIGDPMCSWCYGISTEYSLIAKEYTDDLDMEVVVGGLRAGGGDTWNKEFKNFLKHHWEDVSAKSGVKFNYNLLTADEFDYDTEPSCRAVVTARSMNPSIELAFFKAVQKGFYFDNQDPKQTSFYKDICKEFDLDFDTFSTLFVSEEMKEATRLDFEKSRNLGVNSFPTVLLKKGENTYIVAKGYSDFESMKKRIDQVLSK